MQLAGTSAIVTGGASGLGEACVRMLVESGAWACIFDLQREAGQALAAELGDRCLYQEVDVTSEGSCQQGLEQALQAFGSLETAINCAGIGTPAKVLGKHGPMKLADFRKTVEVNLIGTFNVIRLAAERMQGNQPNQDGERGVIINTASVAAYEGQIGQAAYSASKGGIVSMTLPIAREFADLGIRVMTIAPGLFETPMLAGLPDKARQALGQILPFPKRLGRPTEFAQLAAQIIENPILNGETVRLDSALRMPPK